MADEPPLANFLPTAAPAVGFEPLVTSEDQEFRDAFIARRPEMVALGLGTPGMDRAELHGLIDDLTQWGLRTILRQWLDWRQEGIDAVIAFNISALSLQHLDFPDLVERMCRALNVPTDRIVLELTEGATQPLVKMMDT